MTTEKAYTAEAIAKQLKRTQNQGIEKLKRLAIVLVCGSWWATWTYFVFNFVIQHDRSIEHANYYVKLILSALSGILFAVAALGILYIFVGGIYSLIRWLKTT